MKKNVDYTLYLCTDRTSMSSSSVKECVEKAIIGGCTFIQLREKNIDSRLFFETAKEVKQVTDFYNIPFVINDRLDIALAVNADGLHIGQKDLPLNIVRKLLGNEKIVGVTAPSVKLAIDAQKNNADYIGVGAMFSTSTKENAKVITPNALKDIRKSVAIPIVAIGGINHNNISQIDSLAINGVAVSSAIVSSSDITAAAKKLKSLFTAKC